MLNIPTINDLLYSDACLIFIVVGVTCAIIRWFHMCHPFDKQERYFYPARRQVSMFFAGTLLQIPYVLAPSDPDVWIYIRSLGILYYPMFITCALDRYFYSRSIRETIGSILYVSIPFVWILFLAVLSVYDRPLLCRYEVQLLAVSIAGSLALTVRMTVIMIRMKRQIDAFHEQNFSNESDFPMRFAERIMTLPIGWLLCEWAIFVTGSRELKAFFDITLSLVMILFLCVILHPQRFENQKKAESQPERNLDENKLAELQDGVYTVDDEDKKDKNEKAEAADPKTYESVRQEVLAIVQRRYLEPSLKRSDVIADVQYGRHTLAGLFITEIGFYRLVNTFRLDHARRYAEAHPNLSKDAIAEASGFKDRFALHNAKKRISSSDVLGEGDFRGVSPGNF